MGRSSEKLRRSPLTEYWRAGNVTFRPPVLRSQTANPTSLSPSSGPPEKCSSASASLPGGLPLSFGVNLIVMSVASAGGPADRTESNGTARADAVLAVLRNYQ